MTQYSVQLDVTDEVQIDTLTEKGKQILGIVLSEFHPITWIT